MAALLILALMFAMPVLAAAIVERTKVSVPYLAKEWGVSTTKILTFIKSGELRAINVATSKEQRPRYLIDRADIESFEKARQVVPAPEVAPSTTKRVRRSAGETVRKYF